MKHQTSAEKQKGFTLLQVMGLVILIGVVLTLAYRLHAGH
jgi:Tfp pilus assembly protein PilE